ncbi:hypothetical protein [Pseudonocardia sp. DSM 110487]|nr:hypothetical protein [Pseudonocardia sp. DSM 110487]
MTSEVPMSERIISTARQRSGRQSAPGMTARGAGERSEGGR